MIPEYGPPTWFIATTMISVGGTEEEKAHLHILKKQHIVYSLETFPNNTVPISIGTFRLSFLHLTIAHIRSLPNNLIE